MRSPHDRGLYYSGATGDWVREGYTTWDMVTWQAKFGGVITRLDAKHVIDNEGRHWEFFGYMIPLYDDDAAKT